MGLAAGFQDAAREAAVVFRAAMNAMARPGVIEKVEGIEAPEGLSQGAAALALTLFDQTVTVHLAGAADRAPIRQWITFHTNAAFVAAAEADFVIGTWDALTPITQFKIGTPEYPDRSATLIVEMPELAANGTTLSGPGIRDTAALNLPEVAAFEANGALYPLGLDFFFTCGDRLAALPRTTKLEG